MKGVSPVIESVLLAAAVIMFMLGIVNGLKNFAEIVSTQKLKNTLKIDGEKIAYTILLAKKIGEEGSGEVKIYVDLADIPEVIEVNEDGVVVSSGKEKVKISLHGAERYVNKSYARVTNAEGYKVYVLYSNGEIRLGAD